MAKDERAVTAQSENFSDWYNDVVLRAQLVDRGPVKGTMVIRPYGYRLWELLQSALDGRIKDTGHDNAYFPMFIPESYLKREAEHVEGFAPELAVVTHAGGKELEEPLIVRPTSETIIGEMMSKWIASHRDLPLLLNQWANVVRWELRPRMFLRTTEFLWQEGHTAHADEDDAMRETLQMLDVYVEIARDWAAIPVVPGEKTAGERFAGALRTFTIEGMMRDGKALQSGTSHYMGTNFAKAFDIKYADASSGGQQYCHTTSWGMSTRMIGAIIMAHGDDKGLMLPPKLAPYQVVIIPVMRKGEATPEVTAAVDALFAELKAAGVRAHVDDRPQVSQGFKFNDWEMRGVPLRIAVGPRDLEAGVAEVGNRLTGEKESLPLAGLAASIPAMLDGIQADMLARATAFRDENIHTVDSWDAFLEVTSTGWARTFHCGQPACEKDIKASSAAVTPRCIPTDGEAETGSCVKCGAESAYGKRILFGRAY
ncbi:proline--tRNA ligase [Sporichthya sp.]|uniref:proline--tRNA ligase n=1 Tax=Sporichthya sp. TaxID=65475 RepID=UPI0017B432BA|nr:proline--tRNA ligase [Sporichthya sp.]MBA3745386.1 proline--tRNA ligase [Sporichthya sp.]